MRFSDYEIGGMLASVQNNGYEEPLSTKFGDDALPFLCAYGYVEVDKKLRYVSGKGTHWVLSGEGKARLEGLRGLWRKSLRETAVKA